MTITECTAAGCTKPATDNGRCFRHPLPPPPLTDVIWADPPVTAGRGRPSQYGPLVDQLRANPKRWAIVRKGLKSTTAASSFRKAYPGTEATTRPEADGTRTLYARWVGES